MSRRKVLDPMGNPPGDILRKMDSENKKLTPGSLFPISVASSLASEVICSPAGGRRGRIPNYFTNTTANPNNGSSSRCSCCSREQSINIRLLPPANRPVGLVLLFPSRWDCQLQNYHLALVVQIILEISWCM